MEWHDCQTEGHDMKADIDDNFDTVVVTVECKKCGATAELDGDVRAEDGTYLSKE